MAFEKIYMVPAEDPNLVNLFKGRLTEDPTLDTAAKLMSRKMDILKNPKTSQSFKKQAIKQIDLSIKLYIKKLRQLPASLSVDADPTKLAKSLKDEEGDLATPVQQKLLKRILSDVTPKREPVTPRRALLIPAKRPAPQPPVIKKEFKKPKTESASAAKGSGTIPWSELPFAEEGTDTIPWSELPFAEEGPEPDYERCSQENIETVEKNTPLSQTVKTSQMVDKLGSIRKKEKKQQKINPRVRF